MARDDDEHIDEPHSLIDGRKLGRLLPRIGRTVQEQATKLGISKRTLEIIAEKAELGEFHRCQPGKFETICQKLGVSEDEIRPGVAARFASLQNLPFGDSADLFETLIADRTEFVAPSSRGYLCEKIASLQQEAASSYTIVLGDPGAGKSTFAAKFAVEHECARHFNVASDGITSPQRALRNICLQVLAGYTDEDVTSTASSPAIDGSYLQRVLKRASDSNPREPIQVVIDALDEVDVREQDRYSNVLYLPQSLPPRVHVVLSTRRVGDLRLVTSAGVGRSEIDLSDFPAENERDARGYLDFRFAQDKELGSRFDTWRKRQKLKQDGAVNALVQHSECNFMFLRHAVDAIRSDALPDLKDLAVGLRNYYADHFRRMQATSAERLKVIVALSLRTLKRTSSELATIARMNVVVVEQTLKEWRPFLKAEVDGQRRYGFYHESFRDFLVNDPEIAAARQELSVLDTDATAADLEDCGWA